MNLPNIRYIWEGSMGKSFGEVVSLYMDEQGITQSELARRMGTGRQTINNLLRDNRRGPTLVTAIAVAEAFGVPLSEMVARMQEE